MLEGEGRREGRERGGGVGGGRGKNRKEGRTDMQLIATRDMVVHVILTAVLAHLAENGRGHCR